MNKKKLNNTGWIFVIVAVFLVFLVYFEKNKFYDEKKVCFEKKCFIIEIADNSDERQQGLMFREILGDDEGMLFIFEELGIYPFWMKNTLISLDIIWIDENKEVVFIGENVQPCEEDPCPSVNPGVEALYVFEINGGLSSKMDLKVGDKLIFKI